MPRFGPRLSGLAHHVAGSSLCIAMVPAVWRRLCSLSLKSGLPSFSAADLGRVRLLARHAVPRRATLEAAACQGRDVLRGIETYVAIHISRLGNTRLPPCTTHGPSELSPARASSAEIKRSRYKVPRSDCCIATCRCGPWRSSAGGRREQAAGARAWVDVTSG